MTDEPVGGAPDPFEAAILGLGPDPTTMTAQQLFVAGAEAKAAELGERHGYSMLAAGLEQVLAAQGIDTSATELTSIYHYPLVSFADQGAKPESLPVEQLARAVDLVWTGKAEPSWDLRNVLEGRGTASIGYRGPPNVDWIELQVAEALKKKKIRRGTKKYAEFVEQNREKIVAAATEAARQDAKRQQAVIGGKLEQLNKDRDRMIATADAFERKFTIRRALLDATGVQTDPRSDAGVQSHRDLFGRAVSALDSSINYLQVRFAEAESDVEQQALDALRRSKELAPFAGGAACSCSG